MNIVNINELGLTDPIGKQLSLDYRPGNNTNLPRFRIHKEKLILYISNTLINQFFEKGNEILYCPKRVFKTYIMNEIRNKPTLPMLKGSYFETFALGGGAGGNKVLTLPLNLNGSKTKDQQRIDDQIAAFRILKDKYDMIISDDFSNTQISGMKHFEQSNWLDVEVFLTGEADWITPIGNYKEHSFGNTIVDLKLTKDLTSTFGKYAWGNLEFINTQQGTMYNFIFELPFAFWVFDYKPKGPENKLIFVNHDTEHPNQRIATKAKYRISSTKEVINKTITEICHNFINGWKTNPKSELCTGCPILDCKDKNTLNEI